MQQPQLHPAEIESLLEPKSERSSITDYALNLTQLEQYSYQQKQHTYADHMVISQTDPKANFFTYTDDQPFVKI